MGSHRQHPRQSRTAEGGRMMNKYEVAWDRLLRYCSDSRCLRLPISPNYGEELAPLNELVDKATPKKPIHDIICDSYDEDGFSESFEYEVKKCPNCNVYLYDESEGLDFSELPHCPYCGQAIDWSEEDGSSD